MEVLHRVVRGTARHAELAPTRPTLPQLRELPRDEGGDYGALPVSVRYVAVVRCSSRSLSLNFFLLVMAATPIFLPTQT